MDKTTFRMPTAMRITGRTSSITNAFVNSIIPSIVPTDEEILEALCILGMDPATVECAYCGDASTEWDHLRAIVRNKQPTGFITEIGNLVPACGKCNQSKGNKDWRDWMLSAAPLSPQSKGVADIALRIECLEAYTKWKPRMPIHFETLVEKDLWNDHWDNRDRIIEQMHESQKRADELRALTEKHMTG